jgi:PAS domain S-box-containing protein
MIPMSSPIRVLHVDDNPDFLETSATVLERTASDLEVVTATSPDAGLDVLEREAIDCIVSDYRMPETDGLAFLDAVRESYPDVPFVLFTGCGSERIASRAISAGITDYLRKGGEGTYDRLVDQIRRAVTERETRRFGEVVGHPPMQLVDRITDALMAFDRKWRFTYVNEAAEEMFDESADELLEERIWDLYPGATETAFYDHYQEALAEGEPRTIEQYFEPWDRWYREHIYPSESGLSVVTHDITDSKHSQQQVERAQLHLSEFTDEAGPTLRETLDSLRESLEAVRRGETDDLPRSAFTEFNRAETLASYLLTLAECTDAEVDSHWIDLPSMVHDCWENIDPRNAVLCIDMGQSIRADRTQLRRLLEILLHNAVDHGSTTDGQNGRAGPDPVRVTAGTTDDGFYIADDGPGIPAGDREKVFEPGYSTAADGNGFGLCVVQQVANVHGWDVRVTESEDGGARFLVCGVDVEP